MEINENKKPVWPITIDRVKARPEGRRGIYVAHFDFNGRHSKKSLKTVRKDLALKLAVQLDATLAMGKFSAPPPRRKISDAVTEFIAFKEIEGISRKTRVKYTCELAEFRKFAESSGIDRVEQIDENAFHAYRQHRGKTHLGCDGRRLHEKNLYVGLMVIKGFIRWCARKRTLKAIR